MDPNTRLTQEAAAQLQDYEEDYIEDTIREIEEIVRQSYSPQNPGWQLKLSMKNLGLVFPDSDDYPSPTDHVIDVRSRYEYVRNLLKARFEESGEWTMTYNDDTGFIEIRPARKA